MRRMLCLDIYEMASGQLHKSLRLAVRDYSAGVARFACIFTALVQKGMCHSIADPGGLHMISGDWIGVI
jgi:hypothetical protein